MGEWEAALAGEWNRRIDHNLKVRNLAANGGFLLFVRFLKPLGLENPVALIWRSDAPGGATVRWSYSPA